MSDGFDDFVQLDRTFHDLALSEEKGKDAELFRLMRRDEPLRWPELLKEPRVVLLSEAGSGKTEEVRHVCRDCERGKTMPSSSASSISSRTSKRRSKRARSRSFRLGSHRMTPAGCCSIRSTRLG
jgi:hypothetical protein